MPRRLKLLPTGDAIGHSGRAKRTSETVVFNYGAVSPDVANFLRGQANRRYVGKSVIQIGQDLSTAKHYLSHGEFLRWVESEVGLPARTAQGSMQVANWVKGKSANIEYLPASLLYTLSSRSTPSQLVDELIRRVEADERIYATSIMQQIRAARYSDRGGHHKETSLVRQSSDGPLNPCILEKRDSDRASLAELVAILARALSMADFAECAA